MGSMPRIQEILLPILRGDDRLDGVTVVTWIPDIDYRGFPMLQLRRLGGAPDPTASKFYAKFSVEVTAYSTDGLVECEELFDTALDVFRDAVDNQIITDAGSLQSMKVVMGGTQFNSMFQDSWRFQGIIQFSARTRRTSI